MGTTSGIAGSPSITPTAYTFNAAAGQSIIQYTGTGVAATLPHGLGVTPQMIIVRNLAGGYNWQVYHEAMGATKHMKLNTTSAEATSSIYWNDTSPTSTLFSVGTASGTNQSTDTLLAYCFANIQGYSRMGRYIGNGDADFGQFVYTGFRPAFVMIKRREGSWGWNIFDNKRKGYNGDQPTLFANANNATDEECCRINLLANGFQTTINNGQVNSSGGEYIFFGICRSTIAFK